MSLVHFCLIVDFMVVMPQGPQLMRALEISAQQFGFLVSSYTLGAGLMSLLASFWIDRFDRKTALLASFFAFALCNWVCSWVNTYSAFWVARLLTGAMGGIVGTLLFSVVSDAIDIDRRASALGIVMSAFALASIVGVPLCLWISHLWGWHASFYFLTGVSVLVGATVAKILPAIPSHLKVEKQDFQQSMRLFAALITHPSRILALLFVCFLILGHFSVIPFLFPSVVSNALMSEKQLPVIYIVGGFASILSSILFGKAADRFGKKKVFTFALLGSLPAIYMATHLTPVPLPHVVFVVSSFFIWMGGRLTPAMAIVTATALPQNRASFLSLIGSVQQLSAALAAFLAGLMVTKTDAGALVGFQNVGYMAVGFSLLALAISKKIQFVEGGNTK